MSAASAEFCGQGASSEAYAAGVSFPAEPVEALAKMRAVGDRLRTAYRPIAHIDWVALSVRTPQATNGGSLFRKTGAYAKPIDLGAGGSASEYILTFQNPSSWADLNAHLHRVSIDPREAGLSGIEIAMDFEPCDPDELNEEARWAELSEISAYLLAFRIAIANPQNMRFYGGAKTKTTAASGFGHNFARFAEGQLLAIGSHGSKPRARINVAPDDLAQRIYPKRTDAISAAGSASHLPKELWRARDELTLRGAKLPFLTLAEAPGVNLATLASHWKYRILDCDIDALGLPDKAQLMAQVAALPTLGDRRPRGARLAANRTPRLFSRWTKADAVLNHKTDRALRDLTRRMSASGS